MIPDPDPAACFAQTLAITGGARVPLTSGSSKTLYFMLHHAEGCDAWMTPEKFKVQYGWHLAHHPYFSDVAPPLVSWLLHMLGVFEPIERIAGILAGGGVPKVGEYSPWGYGPRAVWIAASPARITISVREATSREILARPPAQIEPPIEYYAATWPCVHCREVPERYRKLGDSVVCLACGASSKPPV